MIALFRVAGRNLFSKARLRLKKKVSLSLSSPIPEKEASMLY
jgi:hypothetical protein